MGTQTHEVDGELLATVSASEVRQDILQTLLENNTQTPSDLADATGRHISKVSRALSELRDAGGVELLVPDDTKRGRVYGPTDAGRAVVNTLGGDTDDSA
jgi:DNA-binding MarR family transcriptional regulator